MTWLGSVASGPSPDAIVDVRRRAGASLSPPTGELWSCKCRRPAASPGPVLARKDHLPCPLTPCMPWPR